jgi:integrase/recombinase XerC
MLLHAIRTAHPEERALFQLMLNSYCEHRAACNDADATLVARVSTITMIVRKTQKWAWEWDPLLLDSYAALRRAEGIAPTTRRGEQERIGGFIAYLNDPVYRWSERAARAGIDFHGIITPAAHILHFEEHESGIEVRPATRSEIQTLFDFMDAEIDRRAFGGKGVLEAYREATMFRVAYAYGLRRAEVTHLAHHDWYRSIAMPQYEQRGMLVVRNGKGSHGSGPRRRTVYTDPVMDWVLPEVERYLTEIRPRFGYPENRDMFINVHGRRVENEYLSNRFRYFADLAGLDPAITLHALRRSYITHMLEEGHAGAYVQKQVGHLHASTTAGYTDIADDFMLREVLLMQERMLKV